MALHRMSAQKGLVKFVSAAPPPAPAVSSANVVYKRRRPRKYRPKAQVAKSYRLAFHKMAPSKEIRKDLDDYSMNTSTSVATRTEYELLDNIAQGSQLNQRLGANVHISWLHLKGTLQSNSSVKSKALRVMVFREVNLNGVDITTFAGLWKGVGTTTYAPTGTQTDIQHQLNRDLVYPIYDKTHVLKPEYEGIFTFNKKIRINKVTKYSPNLGGTTPVHGRLILLYCLADCDNLASATTCVLASSARIFFKDYNKGR